MKPFFDSSSLLSNPDALQERFGRDGYIYVPGLLPGDHLPTAVRLQRGYNHKHAALAQKYGE